jgi:hypothetical protein
MKKINFLGMELNVLEERDIEQVADEGGLHVYSCIRVADADPSAGSPELRARRKRTLCEDCGAVCWMDPKSFDSLRGVTMTIICIQCTLIRSKKEKAE